VPHKISEEGFMERVPAHSSPFEKWMRHDDKYPAILKKRIAGYI
jgi:hypothetical protein